MGIRSLILLGASALDWALERLSAFLSPGFRGMQREDDARRRASRANNQAK